MGGKKKKGGQNGYGWTGPILTPVSSKNRIAFLARSSVAVAPAFDHCTNRCSARKSIVNGQPTNTENQKWRMLNQPTHKTENGENNPTRQIVNTNITAGGSSSAGAHGREREKGRAEWLRMTTDERDQSSHPYRVRIGLCFLFFSSSFLFCFF